MGRKLKVLMLCDHDSKLSGHIQNDYLNMPDEVEAHMVTLEGLYKKTDYCYYYRSYFNSILSSLAHRVWRFLYCLIKFGCVLKIDNLHSEYCYMDFEYYPYSAKSILRKCPSDFIPDIIAIYWTQGFVSTKVVKNLYKQTKATIIYIMVDEATMTGGCHYPNDCKGYMSDCSNCPALKQGKILSEKQLASKKNNLKDLPLYIYGTPYDLRLACKTEIFSNAKQIPLIRKPEVIRTSKCEVRRKYGISDKDFVVMVGAARKTDVRKGISYSIDAFNRLENRIPNLLVLSVGNAPMPELSNAIRHKALGFVNMNQLYEVFCASDCYLSTTVADSGPMMVNFSIALGVPVISFPVGIAADLIVHKETGYLANYKDVNDIKDGILFMSSCDNEQKKAMSKRCVELIDKIGSKESWIVNFINDGNTK